MEKVKQKFSAQSLKLELLVSQGIEQLFQRLGFLLNALSFLQLLKYPTSLLSLKENLESSQVGWIQKFL